MDSSSALLRLSSRLGPRLTTLPKGCAVVCSYSSQAKATGSSAQSSSSKKVATAGAYSGATRWKDLSPTQKAIRTSANVSSFFTILGGIVVIGGISYFLYQEVFSPDSKTTWFNRAVDRVKADKRCTDLIGSPATIKAFGEQSSSRWAKNRPIASDLSTDKYGVQHLLMHFNVEGEYDRGTVRVHLEKKRGQDEFQYKYLVLEVPGKQPIYLENSDKKRSRDGKRFLGIQWTWSR